MLSMFIHDVPKDRISLFLFHCRYILHFHLSMGIWGVFFFLSCFLQKMLQWTWEFKISPQNSNLNSFGYMYQSGREGESFPPPSPWSATQGDIKAQHWEMSLRSCVNSSDRSLPQGFPDRSSSQPRCVSWTLASLPSYPDKHQLYTFILCQHEHCQHYKKQNKF